MMARNKAVQDARLDGFASGHSRGCPLGFCNLANFDSGPQKCGMGCLDAFLTLRGLKPSLRFGEARKDSAVLVPRTLGCGPSV